MDLEREKTMAKSKSHSKRRSPASIHATQQDVERAKDEARIEATKIAWAIMFRVLIDKHGARPEEIKQLVEEVEDYSDAINKGEVKLRDILQSLKEEDDVHFYD